jgi:hypothetical protein
MSIEEEIRQLQEKATIGAERAGAKGQGKPLLQAHG